MWTWAWWGWRVVQRSGESGQHGQLRCLSRSNEQLSIAWVQAVFWKDAVCTTNAAALWGSHYYYPYFPVGNSVWKRSEKMYFCIYYVNIIITLMAIKMKENINSWPCHPNNSDGSHFLIFPIGFSFSSKEKYAINIIWLNFRQCFKQYLAHIYVLAIIFSSIQTKNL